MATVLIPLAEGCEEMEAVILVDVLRRAGIKVIMAGLHGDQAITASRGVRLLPDVALDDVLDEFFDLVVLPGGLGGTEALRADTRIHQLIQRTYDQGGLVGAICAAPLVLQDMGMLDHRTATAYPGCLSVENATAMTLSTAEVEIDGRILTSRGPGTAMTFAIHIIEQLLGKEKAVEVEAGLVI